MQSNLKCRYLLDGVYVEGNVLRVYGQTSEVEDVKTLRQMLVANKYIIFGDDFKDQDIEDDLQRHVNYRCLQFKKCKNYTRHKSELCNMCRIKKCDKVGCLIHFVSDDLDEEFCFVHTKGKKYSYT